MLGIRKMSASITRRNHTSKASRDSLDRVSPWLKSEGRDVAIVQCLAIRHDHVSIVSGASFILSFQQSPNTSRRGWPVTFIKTWNFFFFTSSQNRSSYLCPWADMQWGLKSLWKNSAALVLPQQLQLQKWGWPAEGAWNPPWATQLKEQSQFCSKSPSVLDLGLYSYNLPRFNGSPCLELHKQEQP